MLIDLKLNVTLADSTCPAPRPLSRSQHQHSSAFPHPHTANQSLNSSQTTTNILPTPTHPESIKLSKPLLHYQFHHQARRRRLPGCMPMPRTPRTRPLASPTTCALWSVAPRLPHRLRPSPCLFQAARPPCFHDSFASDVANSRRSKRSSALPHRPCTGLATLPRTQQPPRPQRALQITLSLYKPPGSQRALQHPYSLALPHASPNATPQCTWPLARPHAAGSVAKSTRPSELSTALLRRPCITVHPSPRPPTLKAFATARPGVNSQFDQVQRHLHRPVPPGLAPPSLAPSIHGRSKLTPRGPWSGRPGPASAPPPCSSARIAPRRPPG